MHGLSGKRGIAWILSFDGYNKSEMTMTTDNIIDLLIIACGGLLVWSIAATLTVLSERKELKKLRKEQQKQDN